MTTKAIIAFYQYRDDALNTAAHLIHNEMDRHAAVFINPPVSMADFLVQCMDYDKKLFVRASRGKPGTLAFQVARTALENSLRLLGNYVNYTAKGDATIVTQSGFPSYVRRYSADTSPPPAPVDVRLIYGPVSGAVLLRYRPGRKRSMNQVEVNTVGPANEAEWKHYGTVSGGRMQLAGFTPGKLIWVRVRTHGIRGVLGNWSGTAELRVL